MKCDILVFTEYQSAAGLLLWKVGRLELLAPTLDLGVVEDFAQYPAEQAL